MTKYAKIAISLPLRAAEHVRNAVKNGEADSVSSYIARAIEERAQADDTDSMRKLLDEMLGETGGPVTPEERRKFRQELGASPSRTKPAKRRAAARPRRR